MNHILPLRLGMILAGRQPDFQAMPDGMQPARRLPSRPHRLDREQVVPVEGDLADVDRVAVSVAGQTCALDNNREVAVQHIRQALAVAERGRARHPTVTRVGDELDAHGHPFRLRAFVVSMAGAGAH